MRRIAILSLLVLGYALLPAQLYATDLAVTKTADQETAAVGDTITFTIVVDNTSTFGGGPLPSNVDLLDRFSSGLSWIDIAGDITAAECQAIEEGGGFDCNFDMGAGDVRTATVTFVVTEAGEQANAVSVAPTIGDPDSSNNEAEALVTVEGVPELRVTKTADDVTPITGEEVTFTITVENTGEGDALDVELLDSFENPEFLRFMRSEGDFSCEAAEYTVRCAVGTLAPGMSVSIDFTFRLVSFKFTDIENTGVAVAQNHESVRSREVNVNPEPDLVDLIAIMAPGGAAGKKQAGIDLYVDSLLVVEDLEPGAGVQVSDFPLRAISPYIHVVPAGGDTDGAVLAEQIDFFTGEITGDDFFLPDRYVLIVAGPENAPTLLLQRDARFEAQDPAQVDVFFAHAAADAPALTLRRFDTDEALTNELDFGALTVYTSLTPEVHTVELVDAAGETLDVFSVDLSDRPGEGLAVIVVPGDGGASDDVALVVLGADGGVATAPVVTSTGDRELPERFALHGNFPNPVRDATTLRFDLPEAAKVGVKIYDALGRRMLTLPSESMPAGFARTLPIDATSLSSGVYFYHVTARGMGQATTLTGRMVVVR